VVNREFAIYCNQNNTTERLLSTVTRVTCTLILICTLRFTDIERNSCTNQYTLYYTCRTRYSIDGDSSLRFYWPVLTATKRHTINKTLYNCTETVPYSECRVFFNIFPHILSGSFRCQIECDTAATADKHVHPYSK